MNLKFPLLNLIARGHLPLANRTASLNFAKSLDEGPATRICFEMLKFDNIKDSALFLEEAQREFSKLENSVKISLSDDVNFRHQRDTILLREDSNPRQEQNLALSPTREFIRLLNTGGIIVAVGWYLSRTAEQKQEIDKSLKSLYPNIYNNLQNNWIGRYLGIPNDKGQFYKRLGNGIIGRKKKNGSSWVTPADSKRVKTFFGKAAGKVGRGALIASSIAVAIAAISLLYKRYFSAAAKECSNLAGKERTICMTKARIKAAEAAISEAEKSLLECSSAKNEEDCIFKMKVEIRAWKKKKMIEEEKLRKLLNVNKSAFGDDKPNDDPFV